MAVFTINFVVNFVTNFLKVLFVFGGLKHILILIIRIICGKHLGIGGHKDSFVFRQG